MAQDHPSLGRPDRRLYLLNAVATVAVAAFYLLIAFGWGTRVVDAGRALRDGASAVPQLLTMVHGSANVIFWLGVGAMTVIRKTPIRRERRWMAWVLPALAMLFTSLAGIGDRETDSLPFLALGTVCVLIGMFVTLFGLSHLGRHFGVVPDVRGLVTSGPYRYVRHPLYFGESLMAVGIFLSILSPLSALFCVLAIAAQYGRARFEEQALTSVFPHYREYAASTPMLLPLPRFRGPLRSRQCEGQGLLEYALIMALVSIVAIGALMLFGGNVTGLISGVASSM